MQEPRTSNVILRPYRQLQIRPY